MSVAENYKRIIDNINKACIESNRNPDDIKLLAVTKTVDVKRITEAIDCGIDSIGENRVQEFLEKYDTLKNYNIDCQIIGHLQTNKVKYIADKVSLIQSVDSIKLLNEINKEAKKHNKVINCLIEINIAGEESKFGVTKEIAEEIMYNASDLDNIRIKGLMAIPPNITDEKTQRKYFAKLFQLFVDIKAKSIDNIDMNIISMGMSNDYYQAILEGSTMIRIGLALFGKRIY